MIGSSGYQVRAPPGLCQWASPERQVLRGLVYYSAGFKRVGSAMKPVELQENHESMTGSYPLILLTPALSCLWQVSRYLLDLHRHLDASALNSR